MGVKIEPSCAEATSGMLRLNFGMSDQLADKIIKDGTLDGVELWSNFLSLNAIAQECRQDPRCIASVSKDFFTNSIDHALREAAKFFPQGSDEAIDSEQEVQKAGELIQNQMKRLAADYDNYGLTSQVISARERLQTRWNIEGDQIDKILSSKPDAVTYYSKGVKNDDKPDMVAILSYLPSTPEYPLTIKGVFDFLVGTMDRYDDYTTLYEEIALADGHLPTGNEPAGTYVTHVVLNLMQVASSTLDTRIHWFRLGLEFGQNAGAFVIRFSLVPGTQKTGLNGLKCTMMEGTVVIRPVEEKNGILIELELDFDLALIPSWLIDQLMTNEVERFVRELVKELYGFVPTRP